MRSRDSLGRCPPPEEAGGSFSGGVSGPSPESRRERSQEVQEGRVERLGLLEIGDVAGAGNAHVGGIGNPLRHHFGGAQKGLVLLAHEDERGDADLTEAIDHRRRGTCDPPGEVCESLRVLLGDGVAGRHRGG